MLVLAILAQPMECMGRHLESTLQSTATMCLEIQQLSELGYALTAGLGQECAYVAEPTGFTGLLLPSEMTNGKRSLDVCPFENFKIQTSVVDAILKKKIWMFRNKISSASSEQSARISKRQELAHLIQFLLHDS